MATSGIGYVVCGLHERHARLHNCGWIFVHSLNYVGLSSRLKLPKRPDMTALSSPLDLEVGGPYFPVRVGGRPASQSRPP
ncbi:MAG: hypothetical protein QOH87_1638 [Trebonia sp.]|jgi:hypothetical protein|nr:hypothetical protein [Trebonia sp.]